MILVESHDGVHRLIATDGTHEVDITNDVLLASVVVSMTTGITCTGNLTLCTRGKVNE